MSRPQRDIRSIPASTFVLLLTVILLSFAALTGSARCEDVWERQFKPRLEQGPHPSPVPWRKDRITYTLNQAKDPTDEEKAAYKRITESMDRAVKLYNENTTNLKKHITVSYSPDTPTADGNSNGSIRIGKNANNTRVCLHEIAHTLGIGTSPQWSGLVAGNAFTGERAAAMLRKITGDKNAVLHADRQHFWPYGLNYDGEVKSDADFAIHCRMVEAICEDLRTAGGH
jgi:hypothetical protein